MLRLFSVVCRTQAFQPKKINGSHEWARRRWRSNQRGSFSCSVNCSSNQSKKSSSSNSEEDIDLCWERWSCFLHVGGTTSVSSGIARGRDDLRVVRHCSWEPDRIISSWRILDVYVVSKVPVVDTEVDPPEQNNRPIRLRIVSPQLMTMNRSRQ